MGVGKKRSKVPFRPIKIIGNDRFQLTLEMIRLGNKGMVLIDLAIGFKSYEFLPDQYTYHRRNGSISRPWLRKAFNNVFQITLAKLPKNLHYLFFRLGQIPVCHESNV